MGSLVCLALFTNLNSEGHSNSVAQFLVLCFMQALAIPFLSHLVIRDDFQAIMVHRFHVNQKAWAVYCFHSPNFHHSYSLIVLEYSRWRWSFATSLVLQLDLGQRHLLNWTCLRRAVTDSDYWFNFEVPYLGICSYEGSWLALSYWRITSLRLVRSLQILRR